MKREKVELLIEDGHSLQGSPPINAVRTDLQPDTEVYVIEADKVKVLDKVSDVAGVVTEMRKAGKPEYRILIVEAAVPKEGEG